MPHTDKYKEIMFLCVVSSYIVLYDEILSRFAGESRALRELWPHFQPGQIGSASAQLSPPTGPSHKTQQPRGNTVTSY
jgi:hypothetical protein